MSSFVEEINGTRIYSLGDYTPTYPVSRELESKEFHNRMEHLWEVVLEAVGDMGNVNRINFVGTGTSGSLLMGLLSRIVKDHPMDVSFTLVAKDPSNSHRFPIEQSSPMSRSDVNIFIDDLTSSGDTFDSVCQTLENDRSEDIQGVVVFMDNAHMEDYSSMWHSDDDLEFLLRTNT